MSKTTIKSSASRITWLSMAANVLLTVLKFIVGFLGGSAALIADAAHSLSDLASDLVVLVGLKLSAKPVDDSHPYGHGKIETTAAVLVGLILIGIGVYIFREGVDGLVRDDATHPGWLALSAAALSIVIKEVLYRVTVNVGRREQKMSVIANAWHHRSDALSSVAALAGVGGNMAGLTHLDQIAAIVVSIFVVHAGANICWQSIKDLIDTAVEEKLIDRMKAVIAATDGVLSFHKLRTRKVGGAIFVDLHLLVDGGLTVREAHHVAEEVEERLRLELKVDDVLVHVEAFICERPECCIYPTCDRYR